jgi:glyoxylase I family protein
VPLPPLPATNFASPFASLKGNHVAVRVPDYEAAKRWYMEKLDFRFIHYWPFGDLQLAYLAPPTDDNFFLEIIGGANSVPRQDYTDLTDSLRFAGYHHFCLMVESVDETVAELRRREVPIVVEPFDLADISRRLAFIADPWNNLVEFAEILR